MANAFFNNFPVVNYNGQMTRNIILRAKFFREVMSNYLAFYPYLIKEGQRADMIAHDYYGDRELDWLVYFSIDLIDPYFDWPMTTDQMNAMILDKYGSYETAVETVHHYEYNGDVDKFDHNAGYTPDYEMTPTTYSFLAPAYKYMWTPVSEYEYQFRRNESKRSIQLLDMRLKDQVIRELSKILK
jgi:hypothetical protein